jgi:uncharacterized protein DUF6193
MSESERAKLRRLYPDLIRAGSLGAALNEALAVVGSALRSTFLRSGSTYADLWSGHRSAHVNVALNERKFLLELAERPPDYAQVNMAGGWTRELSDVAAAIDLVLENGERKVSDLVQEIVFLELRPFALDYERGTYIEAHWQALLAAKFAPGDDFSFFQGLPELIRLASERPELRRLMPFTSLHRFSIRSTPPDRTDIPPLIWPVGSGRYVLTYDSTGERLAEGSASVVTRCADRTLTR